MLKSACGICKIPIGYQEDIRCARCRTPFHLDCVRADPATDEASSDGAEWYCSACSNDTTSSLSLAGVTVSDHQPHHTVDRASTEVQPNSLHLVSGSQLSPSSQYTTPCAPTSLNTSHFEIIMNQFSMLSAAVSDCNSKIMETHEMFAQHASLISDCRADIEALREENQELRRKVSSLEDNLAAVSPHRIVAETKSRLERERNIIIRGVPENGGEETEAGHVKDILRTITEIPDEGVVAVTRVGRNQRTAPRLLKVSFGSVELKSAVLKSKGRLRNTQFKDVYINPDLTPQQSDLLRLARREIRDRQANGESGLRISYSGGEPIVIQPSQRMRMPAEPGHPPLTAAQANTFPQPSSTGARRRDLEKGQPAGGRNPHPRAKLTASGSNSSSFSVTSQQMQPSSAGPNVDFLKRHREEDDSPKREQGVKVPNQTPAK